MTSQSQILDITTKISSSFSLIGSTYLIYQFITQNSSYRNNLSNRIIAYMSVLDIIGSINFFIGNAVFTNKFGCMIQGILVEFSVSGPLWNCCFVMNVMLRVVFNVHRDSANHLEFLYHLVCWGIPLLGSVVGIVQNAFAVAGAYF
eukprot:NODE_237_length_11991_cov_1.642899.p11 type:complete len:146 gc:universal NODE_237_length_11991_cov_1.642899:8868-9305(+)